MNVAPLVAREHALAALDAALASAAAGQGGLVIVTGEPGIGRSRLVAELARDVADAAWGRAWESSGAPAYWPWMQALSALVRARPELGARLLAAEREVLTPIVPELAPAAARGPASAADATFATGDAHAARFRLYHGVSALLRAASDDPARGPCLVVLEDLHSADVASASLAVFLGGELMRSRALVVVTLRDADPRIAPELRIALARAAGPGRTLSLARLDAAAVAALVRWHRPDASDDDVRTIDEASGGNPFLVEGLARAGGDVVPQDVREAVRAQLARLPPEVRAMLEVAALLGREHASDTLGLVLGVSPSVVAAHLATATARGALVARTRDRATRWRFAHGLVRDTLALDLAPERRAALHLAIADALARRADRDAEIAHHLLEAGSEHVVRAAGHSVRAADAALAALAYEDAIALLERARTAAEVARADDGTRGDLLVALGLAHTRADAPRRGAALCAQAAELARRIGDRERFARAALGVGADFTFGHSDPVLVRLLREALARWEPTPTPSSPRPDEPLRARVLARLASAEQPARDPQAPIALAHEAITLARTCGDDADRLAVTHTAMSALMDFTPPSERVGLNLEAERLALALGDRPKLLRARARLVFDHVGLASLDAADRAIAGYAELARALGSRRWLWPLPLMAGMRAAMHGRLDEAFAHLAEAERDAADAGEVDAEAASTSGPIDARRAALDDHRWILTIHRLVLYRTAERTADLVRLLPELDALFGAAPPGAAWLVALTTMVQVRAADLEGARAALARWEPAALVRQLDYATMALVAEVAAALAARPLAELLYARLAPVAGQLVVHGVMGIACEGPFDRVLALLAAALGRDADAERHFAAAHALAVRLDLAPHAARIAADHARWLATRAHAPARSPAATPSRSPSPSSTSVFTLEPSGESWRLALDGVVRLHLKSTRGVELLHRLVSHAGRELHAADLAQTEGDGGDAGELLDAQAKATYRARLAALDDGIAEAEAFADVERLARLRDERDALAAELARAVGLGGRDRRAASAAERARVVVQKRIKDTLKKIEGSDPELARLLTARIRTGLFCAYYPDGRPP